MLRYILGGKIMSFGSRLKELRIERNSSQKEVADDIGISITAISQYESDSRFPNEEMLKRLCLYYKISSDYLLGLTDTKHAPFSIEDIREKALSPKQTDYIWDLIALFNKSDETGGTNDDT